MIKVSNRLKPITYAIRDFIPLAKSLERKGKRIIYLNVGDPVKFDFETPDEFKEALVEAVKRGFNYYSDSQGAVELREAISELEWRRTGVKIDSNRIIVTQGVAEAINFVVSSFIDPGDEVLLPGPSYPAYIGCTLLYNGKPKTYRCIEERGWQPDVDDIRRKITNKTKLIILINPNNPTGAVYEEKTIKEVLNVAAEYEIPLVSDEIYDGIIFRNGAKCASMLNKDSVLICLNGLSKLYLMTGWRIGYIYILDPTGEHEERIFNWLIKRCRLRLSACTPTQIAAAMALRKSRKKHVDEMVRKLRERRDYVYRRIEEIDGLESVKPQGAFYIFPRIVDDRWRNDREFTYSLLVEKGVLVVQGSGFGEEGVNHFRSVLLPPLNVLEEAFNRIEEFMAKSS